MVACFVGTFTANRHGPSPPRSPPSAADHDDARTNESGAQDAIDDQALAEATENYEVAELDMELREERLEELNRREAMIEQKKENLKREEEDLKRQEESLKRERKVTEAELSQARKRARSENKVIVEIAKRRGSSLGSRSDAGPCMRSDSR